jgi:UDP-N-acetyl-D-galactosamine dehydrogenase
MQERIAVIGLGYVGCRCRGARPEIRNARFDIDPSRIDELRNGDDRTREVAPDELKSSSLELTADA